MGPSILSRCAIPAFEQTQDGGRVRSSDGQTSARRAQAALHPRRSDRGERGAQDYQRRRRVVALGENHDRNRGPCHR